MWPLTFISREDFTTHVKKTITHYGSKLEPIDLLKFNKNIIDPIKIFFDKSVYRLSWEEIIKSEIFRQRDKANNNDIGYFHQHIFKYFKNCEVPANGTQGGWDVIWNIPKGINLPDCGTVHKVYVELKNKHNTMNSASAGKTYIKMQSQILDDDDCACFLVEAIAKRSQNIKWKTSIDGKIWDHKNIRRVSLDVFYDMVTGQKDAFYQLCQVLPEVIEEAVGIGDIEVPNDSVYSELCDIATRENISMNMAMLLLGFSTYQGFKNA